MMSARTVLASGKQSPVSYAGSQSLLVQKRTWMQRQVIIAIIIIIIIGISIVIIIIVLLLLVSLLLYGIIIQA